MKVSKEKNLIYLKKTAIQIKLFVPPLFVGDSKYHRYNQFGFLVENDLHNNHQILNYQKLANLKVTVNLTYVNK